MICDFWFVLTGRFIQTTKQHVSSFSWISPGLKDLSMNYTGLRSDWQLKPIFLAYPDVI